MLEKIQGIEARYLKLSEELEAVGADYQKAAELSKERSDLSEIVEKGKEYKKLNQDLEDANELANAEDPEMAEFAKNEIGIIEEKILKLESKIKGMLLPKDPRDDRNVIVEIRAGAGGDEAGIFAADLLRMYTRYAERNRWKMETISANETGVGGIKEATFLIKGKGAFSRLKFETGVHRVQRVPATESQGRIHTSTARLR